jgi:tRNA nucleotidyltransferase/poly(A) polymerase
MENVFTFYEVGGCVRDFLINPKGKVKDVDFSVVARQGLFANVQEAFAALEAHLEAEGFKIFQSRPEFQTIRAQVPAGHPLRQRVRDADFVLARKDGPYSDGRRPDWVLPGTLEDDIFRRDFTVNALCRTVEGEVVDLVGGLADVQARKLNFVGKAEDRVAEDGLRVMRAFRFAVTKGFTFSDETEEVLLSRFAAEMLAGVAAERVREELVKMFQFDTLAALRLLGSLPNFTQEAIFRDGLRLDATMAQ